MKPFAGFLPVALVLLMLSACASQPSVTAPANELSWLIGSWRTQGDTRYTVETWDREDDDSGSLVGESKTMRDGSQIFHESLVIERRAGGMYYVASPQGQPTHAFPLLEMGRAHAVFEDVTHDFPHRISYRLETPDVLVAQIFGKQGGKDRTASWRYTRLVD